MSINEDLSIHSSPISWAETLSKKRRLLTEDKKHILNERAGKKGNKGAALIMRQPCDNEAN